MVANSGSVGGRGGKKCVLHSFPYHRSGDLGSHTNSHKLLIESSGIYLVPCTSTLLNEPTVVYTLGKAHSHGDQMLILREDNKHVEMKWFENTGTTLTVSATLLQCFLGSFLTNYCSIIFLSQDLLLEDLIPR